MTQWLYHRCDNCKASTRTELYRYEYSSTTDRYTGERYLTQHEIPWVLPTNWRKRQYGFDLLCDECMKAAEEGQAAGLRKRHVHDNNP